MVCMPPTCCLSGPWKSSHSSQVLQRPFLMPLHPARVSLLTHVKLERFWTTLSHSVVAKTTGTPLCCCAAHSHPLRHKSQQPLSLKANSHLDPVLLRPPKLLLTIQVQPWPYRYSYAMCKLLGLLGTAGSLYDVSGINSSFLSCTKPRQGKKQLASIQPLQLVSICKLLIPNPVVTVHLACPHVLM